MKTTGSHHDWQGLAPPKNFRYPDLSVLVSADLACFTRPEFPSERVSYAVPTPSALIGALSSVFWKPQFRWVITSVDVLRPVKWATQQRNEVGETPSMKRAVMDSQRVDVQKHRVQRQTLLLRDVSYRVRAQVWPHPEAEGEEPKWRDQFHRRVQRGQWFRPPYLGMREHIADFRADDPALKPVEVNDNLGLMLHSIEYDPQGRGETYTWFNAQLENGMLMVPRVGLSITEAAKGAHA